MYYAFRYSTYELEIYDFDSLIFIHIASTCFVSIIKEQKTKTNS